ncbi:MAG: heterodisulfide reductase-related iron-sulfur binding cluster [Burkholderiaceae bacterium]
MDVTEKATFWYGCNVLRHGDIIRGCIDLLRFVGIEAVPVGGPNYCCGSIKDANPVAGDGMAKRTVERMNQKNNRRMIAWCPSCHLQMHNFMSKGYETNFEMDFLVEVLFERRELLRPWLKVPVPLRIFLHRHVGFNQLVGINRMVPELLAMIPGIEIVPDSYRAPSYMCHALGPHPTAMAAMLRHSEQTIHATSAEALVTIYHQCYRDLCGLERQGVTKVFNYIHLLARSAGIERPNEYMEWKNAGPEAEQLIGPERIGSMGGKPAFDRLIKAELLKLPIRRDQR